jgi:hypothetical protein
MFRRDFFGFAFVPFLGFSNKKKEHRKVQIVELKDETLYVDVEKKYVFKKVFKDGSYHYFNEKEQTHREDGPAVEWSDGTKLWFKEGKYHRLDGPACEYHDGTKFWSKEGKYHREDGPAVQNKNGSNFWYKNGRHHRLDGPAVEFSNGNKIWFVDGIKIKEELNVS